MPTILAFLNIPTSCKPALQMDNTPLVIQSNPALLFRHHFQVNGPAKPGLGFGGFTGTHSAHCDGCVTFSAEHTA